MFDHMGKNHKFMKPDHTELIYKPWFIASTNCWIKKECGAS